MAHTLSNNATRNSARSMSKWTDNSHVQKYLTNCRSFYVCIRCHAHLADHDELISRTFQGNQGRAYLFNSVINVYCGPAVNRQLNTGTHAVSDVACRNCDNIVGWKYERAYAESQKYKEGKYILELRYVIRENRHLEVDKGQIMFGSPESQGAGNNCVVTWTPNDSPSCDSMSSLERPRWISEGSARTSHERQEVLAQAYLVGHTNQQPIDDQELMFPFYDDLGTGFSTFPNSLSSSQQSRARRSLYLSSTPFDWKQLSRDTANTSNTSVEDDCREISHKQTPANRVNITGTDKRPRNGQHSKKLVNSLDSDGGSPAVSSSTSSPGGSSASHSPDQWNCHESFMMTNLGSAASSSHRPTGCQNSMDGADREHETQFNFDADDSSFQVPEADTQSISSWNSVTSGTGKLDTYSSETNIRQKANQQRSIQSQPSRDDTNSNGNNDNDNNNDDDDDDDEFYDCCTGHDILDSAGELAHM